MLYAAAGMSNETDLRKPMVGIASVWYEGNPCNMHTLQLGQRIKSSIASSGMVGYRFGTVGVSDGISMGTDGMRYSLQSRDFIADQAETALRGPCSDASGTVP